MPLGHDVNGRPIRAHTFRGKQYSIVFAKLHKDADGTCSHPESKRKLITIAPQLTGERLLDTLIHEPLHAMFWDMDEEAIASAATDLARWLRRNGYRRTGEADGT